MPTPDSASLRNLGDVYSLACNYPTDLSRASAPALDPSPVLTRVILLLLLLSACLMK